MNCFCGRELPEDYKFEKCGICRSFDRLQNGKLQGDIENNSGSMGSLSKEEK